MINVKVYDEIDENMENVTRFVWFCDDEESFEAHRKLWLSFCENGMKYDVEKDIFFDEKEIHEIRRAF